MSVEKQWSAKPSQGIQVYIPERKVPDGKIKSLYFDGRRYDAYKSEKRKLDILASRKTRDPLEDFIEAYEIGSLIINSLG